MTTIPEILNSMSGPYSEEKNQFINYLNSYDLLIIDDFNMDRDTAFSNEQIFNIIDNRYKSGKPLIVITTANIDTFNNPSNNTHAKIYYRIIEKSIPIVLEKQNIRKLLAQKNMLKAKKCFDFKHNLSFQVYHCQYTFTIKLQKRKKQKKTQYHTVTLFTV